MPTQQEQSNNCSHRHTEDTYTKAQFLREGGCRGYGLAKPELKEINPFWTAKPSSDPKKLLAK